MTDYIKKSEAIENIRKHIEIPDNMRVRAIAAVKNTTGIRITPCDVCVYDPPSSGDGKPCSLCPACVKN